MSSKEQFAAETAIGLVKPFHRVECRCEACIGWLQIELCKQWAELKRLREAFEPVQDWHEGEGDRDLPSMLVDAVADLQAGRKELLESRKEVKRLRLERDVLAMNREPRGSEVKILYDEAGEVVQVIWPTEQLADETPVRLPAYAAEAEGGE